MGRGRKPSSNFSSVTWNKLFWQNLPVYIGVLNNFFKTSGIPLIEVTNCLEKLSFTLPKGLISNEIKLTGRHPVISQSKEYIIGFSDKEELLITKDLPLIVFGDHSKTLKYVDQSFIIGADGVKLIKPKKIYNEKFVYYFLHGVLTETKDYGRHFSLLKQGLIADLKDLELQNSVVNFLDDLSENKLLDQTYFNPIVETTIINLHKAQFQGVKISAEVNTQLLYVKQLRQAFLREAMQGKLLGSSSLENSRGEVETGQQLLEKIKAEKAQLIKDKKLKKEKELPPITPEEIPFKIPENWVWCRLGEIALSLSTGPFGTMLHKSDYVQNGIPLVNPMNIVNGKIVASHKMMVNPETTLRLKSYILKTGDVVIGRRGEMGRCAIVTKSENGWLCGTGSFFLDLNKMIDRLYFLRVFSSGFSKALLQRSSVGSTMDNLNHKILNLLPIPLPPLSEQNRIVAKLEQLMQTCDQLEQSIIQSELQNEQLLQQVLKEALEVKEEIY